MKKYDEIIKISKILFQEARKLGIENLFQPGLIKEIIIADILSHSIILEKHQADAKSYDGSEFYEYLSCICHKKKD